MNYFEIGIEIIKKIESLGYNAYIVGGAVRDLLLNMPINDIDIATNMPLEKINEHFEVIDNGSKYYSIIIKYNNYLFETTHFRRDLSYQDNRHPLVENVDTFKEDTLRRDFTINALGYDKDGKIIDYYNGLDDLKNKVIKTIGDPKIRFTEDSLRILRALNFASKLGFYIDEETALAMNQKCDLLRNLSDQRLYEYFVKILHQRYDYGIQYINHYDYFRYIPEYKRFLECVKREYREEDLIFYYYFKYNEFLNITKEKEKKIALEGKELLDNNFDIYYLYLYKQAYLRLENVFKNLGYDTISIDKRLDESPLNNKKIDINGNDLKDYFKEKEIGVAIKMATKAILYGEINNIKEEIIEYLINKK